MTPLILKSSLTTPPRWYIATRYTIKQGVHPVTGKAFATVVAHRKYDVTDQVEAILKTAKRRA